MVGKLINMCSNYLMSHHNVKRLAPFVLFTLLVVLCYRAWFLSYMPITHGDWWFFGEDALDTLRLHYFSTWLSDTGSGRVLIDIGQAPTYFLYGVLSKFFSLDYSISERLIHLFPAALICPLSSYYLGSTLFEKKLPRLTVATVYSFNTYYLTLTTGHLTLAVAYALLPFLASITIKFIQRPSLAGSMLIAIIFTLLNAYEPRMGYISLFIIFLIITMHSIVLLLKNHITESFLVLRYATTLAALIIVINVYWLLAVAITGGSGVNERTSILNRGLFGENFFDISHAVSLYFPYWTHGKPAVFTVQMIPWFYWILPIILVYRVARYKINLNLTIFIFITLIGILLSKQSSAPFTSLYSDLYDILPGFSAFREPSKFYTLIALGYAVVAGYAVQDIRFKAIGSRASLITFIIIFSTFVPNLSALIGGRLETTHKSSSIPSDYTILNNYLNKDKSYGRTLWLPIASRWGYSSINHPIVSAIALTSDSTALENTKNTSARKHDFRGTYVLNSINSRDYLNDLSIKYLVIPTRDTMNDDDFYIHYGNNREFFVDQLEDRDWLEQVDLPTDELMLFMNTSYSDKFSFTENYLNKPDSTQPDAYYNFYEAEFGNYDYSEVRSKQARTEIIDITNLDKADYNNAISVHFIKNSRIVSVENDAERTRVFVELIKNEYTDDGFIVKPETKTLVYEGPLTKEHYITDSSKDTILLPNTKNKSFYLGRYDGSMKIMMKDSINLLQMPLEDAVAIEKNIINCNHYTANSYFEGSATKLNNDTKIVLKALASNPCASIKLSEQTLDGEHILNFNYSTSKTNFLSYELFSNSNVISREHKTVPGGAANNEIRLLNGGDAITEVRLWGNPDDTRSGVSTIKFENIKLFKVQTVYRLEVSEGYETISLPKQPNVIFRGYKKLNNNGENIVPNGSFESGLWQSAVSDCNNYSDNPLIGMSLTENSSDGDKALMLTATRHTACTSSDNISVEGGSTYDFEFDYSTINTTSASYLMQFNDSNKTTLYRRVHNYIEGYEKYVEKLKIPLDASEVSITFYSEPSRENTETINIYDNVQLNEVPDYGGYGFLSASSQQYGVTQNLSINNVALGHTKNEVTISNIERNTVLKMSESFHPKWRVIVNTGNTGWTPWNKVEAISSDNHFELNGWQNGWYIDLNNLCVERGLCTQNEDGSWNIDLIIEFEPQRWFYIGSIISGTTFAGIVGYLGYDWVRSLRRRKKYGVVG